VEAADAYGTVAAVVEHAARRWTAAPFHTHVAETRDGTEASAEGNGTVAAGAVAAENDTDAAAAEATVAAAEEGTVAVSVAAAAAVEEEEEEEEEAGSSAETVLPAAAE
jgi:hypothetical protein